MDNVQAVAIELARIMTMDVIPMPNRVMIDTAEGLYLDRKAQDFNMTRNENETDESFRKRILEKIQRPIVSGNKNHYIHWAKEVSGVGEAKVISCWNGNGTVKVIILSDNYDVPSNKVIQNVQEYIDENKPIGAEVTVVGAEPLGVSIDAVVELESVCNIEEVKIALENELNAYLKSISFDENKTLSYYKIGDIIFAIDGVIDILNYTLNGNKTSIKTDFGEFFRLNEVMLNSD